MGHEVITMRHHLEIAKVNGDARDTSTVSLLVLKNVFVQRFLYVFNFSWFQHVSTTSLSLLVEINQILLG